MPELWIMRHGDAVPHGSREHDADRELTDNGVRQSQAAGRALARLGVRPDACMSSPKLRARQTAEGACAALGLPVTMVDGLAEGLDVALVAELLAGFGDSVGLLLVGHEPQLTQVVHDLTGARVAFERSGVAGIAMEGRRRGRLDVLLTSRELAALAG